MQEAKKELCAFIVNGQLCAVPILEVQEIIRPQNVTRVPLAEDCVRGLINLRGHIVTLISLRTLLGFKEELNQDYMNIVVKKGDGLFSLVVDEICDVIEVDQENFCTTPDTLDEKLKKYLAGVYKLDGKLLMLLDLDKIFNKEASANNSKEEE